MDDADAVMSDTVGRVRDKKELSVLMPKMTESEMRRVHSWQMDRVKTDIKGFGLRYNFQSVVAERSNALRDTPRRRFESGPHSQPFPTQYGKNNRLRTEAWRDDSAHKRYGSR